MWLTVSILYRGSLQSLPEFLLRTVIKSPEFHTFCDNLPEYLLHFPQHLPICDRDEEMETRHHYITFRKNRDSIIV